MTGDMERGMETVNNTEKKYTDEDLLHFVALIISHQRAEGDFKELVKIAYNEFINFKNLHRSGQRLFRDTNEQGNTAIGAETCELTAAPSTSMNAASTTSYR